MKTTDDGLTPHEDETMSELRDVLERAWKTLDAICRCSDDIEVAGVVPCARGAKARVEDALHDVLGRSNRQPGRSKDQVASLRELRGALEEADELLSRAAGLAEDSEHAGTTDVTDSVGEAASLVRRARGRLPRGE